MISQYIKLSEKMKEISFLVILFAIIAVLLVPSIVLGVTSSSPTNVTVQIASKTAADINPAEFIWLGVNPGSVGGPSEEVNNYYAIQIENIGSHNITKIWFNATYPSSRPFASGTNSTYDTGNFVVLAQEGTNNFYFPNRLEFNESRSIVYLRDPSGNLPVDGNSYSYGRFRNSSYEYFWMVSRGDNCVSQTFYIGEDPHTETQTGTTNFQGATTDDDGVCVVTLAAADDGWCYADLSGATDPDCAKFGYTVYVKNETYDQVFFAHWNKDLLGGYGSNQQYFFNGNLVPGDSVIGLIRVFVPYGVYEGYIKTGILTVIVSD